MLTNHDMDVLTELSGLFPRPEDKSGLKPLRCLPMIEPDEAGRDLAVLVVQSAGELRSTDDPWQPFRLLDPSGQIVQPVASYLSDLQAARRSNATQRSYGMDLLRWFRFLWAIEFPGDR